MQFLSPAQELPHAAGVPKKKKKKKKKKGRREEKKKGKWSSRRGAVVNESD